MRHVILDPGATTTFVSPQDGAIPIGKRPTKRVQISDGQAVQASEESRLPWTTLPDKARECGILPSLEHKENSRYRILLLSYARRKWSTS